MTTRKYNAVKKQCGVSAFPSIFDAVYNAAVSLLGDTLNTMTAKQIASIIEFGYSQHTHGEVSTEE